MRHISIIILLILVSILGVIPESFAAVKGGIEYSIPVDYSKLSDFELKVKADKYFYLAEQYKDSTLNDDITNALMLYSILQNINPENEIYSIRLGILYDKINVTRYAKGNFSRAIGVAPNKPEPYFYFGEYYYKKQMYRKALKYYKEALAKGYSENYDLNLRLGDIYEKLGDTKLSLIYLKKAASKSPNDNLDNKIKRVETFDSTNRIYNSK